MSILALPVIENRAFIFSVSDSKLFRQNVLRRNVLGHKATGQVSAILKSHFVSIINHVLVESSVRADMHVYVCRCTCVRVPVTVCACQGWAPFPALFVCTVPAGCVRVYVRACVPTSLTTCAWAIVICTGGSSSTLICPHCARNW